MTAERCVAALIFESLFQARPPHEEIVGASPASSVGSRSTPPSRC